MWVRGCCSTLMSWVMILFVSSPDARPLTDETGVAISPKSLPWGACAGPSKGRRGRFLTGPACPAGGRYWNHLRSCRTVEGIWLAWASMAVPAWDMIWLRVKETISRDMSVSRTRDSDEVRFSEATERLATMCSKRFWVAPRVDRALETSPIAESSMAMAEVAPALVV